MEIERGLLLEDARAVTDDMLRFPFQLALGQAFQDAGYGAPTLGTPDSLAGFDAHAVRSWHERMLVGGRTTVIAVGSMDQIKNRRATGRHVRQSFRRRIARRTTHDA